MILGCFDGDGVFYFEIVKKYLDLVKELKVEYKVKFILEFVIVKVWDI